jgi:hypothetical protein
MPTKSKTSRFIRNLARFCSNEIWPQNDFRGYPREHPLK